MARIVSRNRLVTHLPSAGLGVMIFILAFLVSAKGIFVVPDITVTWPGEHRGGYLPMYNHQDGRELVMVYFGSESCGPSNVDYLPEAVEEIKLALRETAFENAMSFSTIGVGIDWAVEDGIQHLRKFGQFDEIMSGRSWLNRGAFLYAWQEVPGEAATPQVVVISRDIIPPSSTRGSVSIRDVSLVTRVVGPDRIRDWIRSGAPVYLGDSLN